MSEITLSFLPRVYLSTFLRLVLTILLLSSLAQGQSTGTSPSQPDSPYEVFEHPEKSLEARCARAKEFLEKFPNVDDYWKKGPRATLKRCELIQTYTQCQNADKSYFASPNTDSLNKMVEACDLWLDKSSLPPDISVLTRLSFATGFGVLADFYKDVTRSAKYAEKALELLTQPTKPQEWPQKSWDNFRKESIGRLHQYLGLCKLRQEKPAPQVALEFLSKAAEDKEYPTYKDPNTYLLRAEANYLLYEKLNSEYSALPTDSGEEKKLLVKIYPIVDSIIEDYARVIALTENKAELQLIYHKTCKELDKWALLREKNATIIVNKYKQEFGIN